MSGADAMMSSKPNLYKQLQSVKPAADVIESIDMGEIYIFTVFLSCQAAVQWFQVFRTRLNIALPK